MFSCISNKYFKFIISFLIYLTTNLIYWLFIRVDWSMTNCQHINFNFLFIHSFYLNESIHYSFFRFLLNFHFFHKKNFFKNPVFNRKQYFVLSIAFYMIKAIIFPYYYSSLMNSFHLWYLLSHIHYQDFISFLILAVYHRMY